ncbi:peptidoglycan-binding protein [Streptomyces bicolor]|uniref:peptidoglycan-binding protein n=1 Tax=Streptomyces bicolor TaxID=66874 RepID=UPI0004E26769|nr:peptidoglycan-binding protein [Streptomyces bicolor]
METQAPVFEEFDPESGCDCPGCVHWRRVLPHSTTARHPAAGRALIVAAAASTTLAVGHAAPALAAAHAPDRPGVPAGDEPASPQGGKAPLYGPGGQATEPGHVKTPATTRAEIIRRAKKWVAARVPYSMSEYWSDGYRQDCSGFVSMAWNLPGNEWTGSLDQYGVRISREDLQPGDILLFHNPDDPEQGSHVVIFGGWTDYTRTYYVAYESTRPHARRLVTPYAYWSHSDRYLAYRYKGLVSGATGAKPDTGRADAEHAVPYPGRAYFGPGANNKHVARLGRMLVERGAGRFYPNGPGPRWTDADRRATRAFQLAQGWRGRDADGLPGARTWALLVTGKGKDVPAPVEEAGTGGAGGHGAPAVVAPASHGVPGYPGRAMFRPGVGNEYVTQLRGQLVKKGFGKHYKNAPGPSWGEADRRGVEDFQRAQGWRGGAADGCPGPETWRRLFS